MGQEGAEQRETGVEEKGYLKNEKYIIVVPSLVRVSFTK